MTTDQTLVNATIARLVGERDRARDVAVALEAQVARVAELHRPGANGLCQECLAVAYPCDTALAIGLGKDQP